MTGHILYEAIRPVWKNMEVNQGIDLHLARGTAPFECTVIHRKGVVMQSAKKHQWQLGTSHMSFAHNYLLQTVCKFTM